MSVHSSHLFEKRYKIEPQWYTNIASPITIKPLNFKTTMQVVLKSILFALSSFGDFYFMAPYRHCDNLSVSVISISLYCPPSLSYIWDIGRGYGEVLRVLRTEWWAVWTVCVYKSRGQWQCKLLTRFERLWLLEWLLPVCISQPSGQIKWIECQSEWL